MPHLIIQLTTHKSRMPSVHDLHLNQGLCAG